MRGRARATVCARRVDGDRRWKRHLCANPTGTHVVCRREIQSAATPYEPRRALSREINTNDNPADLLTKSLLFDPFRRHSMSLLGKSNARRAHSSMNMETRRPMSWSW